MTTILTKKKDTTGAPAPGDLTNSAGGAELAVNTFDKRLYTKDSGGNIVEIGTNPSTIDTTNVDTANLEVTNIKAKDGTASATIANSTGIFTHSTAAVFTAGTVSAPAITTTGDTNTGIFFPAADTIAFTEGGVEAMRIDSAGNLGLGVTPSAWSGTTSAFQNPSGSIYSFSSGSQFGVNSNAYYNGTNWIYRATAAAGDYYIQSGAHIWRNAASGTAGNAITFTQAMTLDASGNLGIGTTSPRVKLDVSAGQAIISDGTAGAASTGGTLWLNTGTSATSRAAGIQAVSLTTSNDHSLLFYTNAGAAAPVERMRIDSSGNVGIGVTPPTLGGIVNNGALVSHSYILSRPNGGGTDTTALTTNASFNGTNWVYRTSSAAARYDQWVGTHEFYTAPSGTAGNTVTFTKKIRIDSDGIKFNGDTAAANALDDYEEGAFTPTIVGTTVAGTGTYTTQAGNYTKIGRFVYVKVNLVWTAHTGTGGMTISGLPFTSAAGGVGRATGSLFVTGVTYTGTFLQTALADSSTTVGLEQATTNAASAVIPMDTNASVLMTICYQTA